MAKKRSAEKAVRDIRRTTRRHYSSGEKTRMAAGTRATTDLLVEHLIYCDKIISNAVVFTAPDANRYLA